ncbi:hypothetical protein B0J13DRAFT_134204 [Dactylonectria estremocensis]|uniref:Uncharacterized protein n=1 Tax=Dactylonectria estremocensis TaxID=1079267 RepID=A0A9P9E0J5_9HYPO|nr:hypothetical protein B0J13DRAFT_134204 [Dactylonectria estremocensis]
MILKLGLACPSLAETRPVHGHVDDQHQRTIPPTEYLNKPKMLLLHDYGRIRPRPGCWTDSVPLLGISFGQRTESTRNPESHHDVPLPPSLSPSSLPRRDSRKHSTMGKRLVRLVHSRQMPGLETPPTFPQWPGQSGLRVSQASIKPWIHGPGRRQSIKLCSAGAVEFGAACHNFF